MAAAVTYATTTQVDAKIAAAIAAYKKTVDAKFITDATAASKFTTDKVGLLQTTVNKQGMLVAAAQTSATGAVNKNTAQDSDIAKVKSLVLAIPKDSLVKLIQALQEGATGAVFRLDKYNTRLYQLEFNDSTKNRDIYYLRGKVGDLTALYNSRDSLVGNPGQIQVARLPTGVVMISLEPEILLRLINSVGKLKED